jgi:hypothetical protein
VKSKVEPVIFVHPVLAGHENHDVDRKRLASLAVATGKAEAAASVAVLTSLNPAKRGKGESGASMRTGKEVAPLNEDNMLTRLREKVQILLDSAQTARCMDPGMTKSILILTNGKWQVPVFSAGKLITAGCYHEISVEDIDATFLGADGLLKKEILYFACRCPPCIRKAATGVFATKPTGRAAAAGKKQAPPCSWYRSEVRAESSGGKHSSKTLDGGVILVSLWTMMKDHMEKEHGGGFDAMEGNKAAVTSRIFTLGAGLMQTPGVQAALQDAADAQSTATTKQPSLTPADPPEPPHIVMRYPFDATADTQERNAAAIKMEDISTQKLAPGSMVSEPVFDLLRRYELQCALNMGTDPSEQILVIPPFDFQLIARRMLHFQKTTGTAIDYLPHGSLYPTF